MLKGFWKPGGKLSGAIRPRWVAHPGVCNEAAAVLSMETPWKVPGRGLDALIFRCRGNRVAAVIQAEPPPAQRLEEEGLLVELRSGDEGAFLQLVDRYNASMIRIARAYVGTRAAAEDVAQDAWLAVLNGIERFEGRSSLKTWLFRIVVNSARARGAREGRLVPFSALETRDDEGLAADPDRFHDASSRYAGNWASPPQPWAEQALIANETIRLVQAEIGRLPARQRAVITMRDVEGLEAREVCDLLGVSETNQRVLLHRARSQVRAALEQQLTSGGVP